MQLELSTDCSGMIGRAYCKEYRQPGLASGLVCKRRLIPDGGEQTLRRTGFAAGAIIIVAMKTGSILRKDQVDPTMIGGEIPRVPAGPLTTAQTLV